MFISPQVQEAWLICGRGHVLLVDSNARVVRLLVYVSEAIDFGLEIYWEFPCLHSSRRVLWLAEVV